MDDGNPTAKQNTLTPQGRSRGCITRCCQNPCWSAVIAAVVGLSGCGTPEYPFAPVAGQVTLDGAPVPNARMTFEPLADSSRKKPGPWSVAAADSDGRFTMNTVDGTSGAVVGRHRVRISTRVENEDGTAELVPEIVPTIYNEQSELIFEVKPDGHADVHFDLQTPV